MAASTLIFFGALLAPAVPPAGFGNVTCEGLYAQHLQGICTDNREAIFRSFTNVLVKSDRQGRVLKTVPVASHHGDLLKTDSEFRLLGKYSWNASLGIVALPDGRVLSARGTRCRVVGCTGNAVLVEADPKKGLAIGRRE